MKIVMKDKRVLDVEPGSLEDLQKIETDPISKQRFIEAKNDEDNHRGINKDTFQPVILYGGKGYTLVAMLDMKAEGSLK